MATELTVQSERAYQKQPHIFLNHKAKSTKSKRVGKGGRRWYKDIGLGFKTPKEAITGSYIGTPALKAISLSESCVTADISPSAINTNMPASNRQEMPLHRPSLDPWQNLDWKSCLNQNAQNPHYPSRIPPLHPQIRPIREATFKLGCTRQSSFSS